MWFGIACLVAAGCGGEKGTRCDVAGTVTFDGTPLVAGRIYFTPDASKKNTGPQGVADIRDGRFDTRIGRGRGGPGGPVIVLIQGFDGKTTAGKPMGNATFSYETKIELPRESATQDFHVKSAEVRKATSTGPAD
jgi:hypothetical protein